VKSVEQNAFGQACAVKSVEQNAFGQACARARSIRKNGPTYNCNKFFYQAVTENADGWRRKGEKGFWQNWERERESSVKKLKEGDGERGRGHGNLKP
jgi:hypothetical protein